MDVNRGAAAQTPKNDTQARPELDALIQRLRGDMGNPVSIQRDLNLYDAVIAIAAERNRADRAEARLAEVWDEALEALGDHMWDGDGGPFHNPYRSQATA